MIVPILFVATGLVVVMSILIVTITALSMKAEEFEASLVAECPQNQDDYYAISDMGCKYQDLAVAKHKVRVINGNSYIVDAFVEKEKVDINKTLIGKVTNKLMWVPGAKLK